MINDNFSIQRYQYRAENESIRITMNRASGTKGGVKMRALNGAITNINSDSTSVSLDAKVSWITLKKVKRSDWCYADLTGYGLDENGNLYEKLRIFFFSDRDIKITGPIESIVEKIGNSTVYSLIILSEHSRFKIK